MNFDEFTEGQNLQKLFCISKIFSLSPDIGISEDPVKIGFLVGEDASLSCKVKNPTDNPATASWVQVTDSGDKVVEDQYIEWANESPVGTSTLRYDRLE